ncbi:acetyl-CoA synthetase [Ruminiclostridium sufflavum DSM 19573]|uniref:Acetyl-CoA synthetase n=1 Tax=Ruminiclostridium sufflavum DSM 19573 TaxID=1121337 RepID=A0A318XLZ0_9FIRM|nr:AMP-binding protein [Ruminiclostridium sufflavum]PYG86972.1 acetyl-CoA synthetase [Ruminiclostridium sufflavum DSM 19573]
MGLEERYLERTEFDSYEDFSRNFKLRVPENFNFAYDIIDGYAESEPERLALVWCDDKGNERKFTFRDLKYWSDKTANYLKAKGIGKGDKLIFILRRRFEFYFFAFAACKIGAVFIPCTNQLMKKDIVYRNNAAGVKAIIAYNDDGIPEHADNSRLDSPTVDTYIMVGGSKEGWFDYDSEIESAGAEWSRPEGDGNTTNEDLMMIYFTSGTTSMPKMAMHDFTYPLGHIVTAKYWHRVVDKGLHISVAESGWAKFGWGKLFGQWICGAVQFLYDMERFDPCNLLEKLSKYDVKTFCAPPTIYRFLLQHDIAGYDLSSLNHCSTAGEPLNPEIFNRFKNITGHEILNGFGQTETTVIVANFEWLKVDPGAMGMPNPAYNIDVVDENNNSCPAGEEGELVIRDVDTAKPAGLFCGYYKDSESTAKVWYNNTYHTGDVVYRDEHGFLWFVGRNDDVIKASGYRISPFEVESALIEHPAVLECAVTGAPDSIRGTVVKATVTLSKGYEPSEELKKDIQNYVKKVTAPYKYPRIIEFADELPKTISGKIKRAHIRHEDNKNMAQNKGH